MGSAGHVTAYADGAQGRAATFDWGDGSGKDVDVVNPDPSQSPTSTHTYTANGTFTITVSSGGQSDSTDVTISDLSEDPDEEAEPEAYDPGAHTVTEVQDYVTANPGQAQAVRDAEAAGKNRSTLLTWLDGVIGG